MTINHNEWKQQFDKMMNVITEQRSDLDRLEKKTKDALDKSKEEKQDQEIAQLRESLENIEAAANRPAANSEGKNFSQHMEEYKNAWLSNFVCKGRDVPEELAQKAWGPEYKNLQVGTGTGADGEHLVPEQIAQQILDQVQRTSPVRSVANVTTVGTSDYKRLVNVHGAGTGWVSETAARPETNNPPIQQVSFPVGTVYSHIFATQHILDDSFIDLESWLMGEVATEITRTENAAFVNGTGNAGNQPKGFLDVTYDAAGDAGRAFGTVQGLETGADGAFAADPNAGDVFISALMALAPGYRPNATFAMNSTTEATVRKFKTSDGQYIWQPGLQAGMPNQILGRPVVNFEDMPDYSTSDAKSVVVADWQRFYEIVDRVGMTMLRDPYSNKPFVTFYATKRTGGNVVDSKAAKAIVNSADTSF